MLGHERKRLDEFPADFMTDRELCVAGITSLEAAALGSR